MTQQNDLISKRDEVLAKIKQAEADLYFLQGYLQSLNDLIEEAKNEPTES